MNDPIEVWLVPKVPLDIRFLHGTRIQVMAFMDDDDMDPTEARHFAALYLAAADEVERILARRLTQGGSVG